MCRALSFSSSYRIKRKKQQKAKFRVAHKYVPDAELSAVVEECQR